jgi:UDP-glucuronate decarboxylase
MKILVTGGAGFLGSNLCRKLLLEDNEIICVDNLYTGSKKNILDLFNYDNFEFIRHDVTFPLYLEIDQIYHLACPASPVQYQRNPVQTIKTCVIGTTNMLGLAKRTGASMLQASTSEIYGDPEIHPQTEDYWGNVNPIGIRACYDEGKRCAETLCMDYKRQYNVDIKIARIFNTYGPMMDINDGRVVSNFIVQALNNEPITVYGDGLQSRSFCFVDDLIDGFIKLINHDGNLSPMNLGNPNEFTIMELANKIIKLTNSKSIIDIKPLPQDDPRQRQPNIAFAKKMLKWQPKVELEEGLSITADWFSNMLTRKQF